ncbi:hypothetical protein NUSPORA_00312 [Nucleospora cyclopteri]
MGKESNITKFKKIKVNIKASKKTKKINQNINSSINIDKKLEDSVILNKLNFKDKNDNYESEINYFLCDKNKEITDNMMEKYDIKNTKKFKQDINEQIDHFNSDGSNFDDIKIIKNSKIDNDSNSQQKEIKFLTENTYIIDPRKDISIFYKYEKRIEQYKSAPINDLRKLEKMENENNKIYKQHPELQKMEYEIFNKEEEEIIQYSESPFLKTKLMKHQIQGVSWMLNREKSNIKGGILADEMGLGKTLQTIALMLTGNKKDINLIVTPAVAMYQWVEEINKHSPDIFNISYFYGPEKNNILNFSNHKINIIMTTYGTLQRRFKTKKSDIHKIEITRVILDEAHNIKDTNTSIFKTIMALKTKYKWGLTGTPLQNRIGDIVSLVKFLKLDPHSYYFCKDCNCKSVNWLRKEEKNVLIESKSNYVTEENKLIDLDFLKEKKYHCLCGHFASKHFGWWNRRIGNPIKLLGHCKESQKYFDKLQKIINQILLRRTKNGIEKELGLPSKVVATVKCLFSNQEKEYYDSLYKKTKGEFNKYAENMVVLLKNYAHVFELLNKMRMAVNHPFLLQKEKGPSIIVCGFCNEEADDPIRSRCNHFFCRKEAEIFINTTTKCPVCKIPITIDLQSTEDFSNYSKGLFRMENWISSTKVEKLIEMLYSFKKDGRKPKSIVFSQFVHFLELMRWRLERAGFRVVKIYGSMNIKQRKAAIQEFNSNPEITIFLISLRAGGVALNLTEAENVFLMDLWWNPAVEEQAMDRIHRIGQFRPIKIFRIIIENSIESRILQLQQKKKALVDSTVDNNPDALQRLTAEDLLFLFN